MSNLEEDTVYDSAGSPVQDHESRMIPLFRRVLSDQMGGKIVLKLMEFHMARNVSLVTRGNRLKLIRNRPCP